MKELLSKLNTSNENVIEDVIELLDLHFDTNGGDCLKEGGVIKSVINTGLKNNDLEKIITGIYLLICESIECRDWNCRSWEIYGEWFQFPSCCIEAFVTADGAHKVMEESSIDLNSKVWLGTGFIPCIDCAPKLKTDKDLEELLGRSIHEVKHTVGICRTKEGINILEKHGVSPKVLDANFILDSILTLYPIINDMGFSFDEVGKMLSMIQDTPKVGINMTIGN